MTPGRTAGDATISDGASEVTDRHHPLDADPAVQALAVIEGSPCQPGQFTQPPGQDLRVSPAEELIGLRPGHGGGAEAAIVGPGKRSLELIGQSDDQALAAARAGQDLASARPRHDLLVVPAGEQTFKGSHLDQRINAASRENIEWPARRRSLAR